MEPENWQRIQDIFYGALPLPHDERVEFVSVESLGDAELSGQVLSLLHEDEENSLELLESSLFELGASVIVEQDELDIGVQLGSYRVQSLLGSGGMGSVYLAEDIRLDRLAALKVLPLITTAGSKAIEQFHGEARAASGIAHPNIAHIYEFSESGGRHFLAMEYVEGPTLRSLIKEKKTDINSSLRIVRQVCQALIAAHAKGIIHRDIKPENIIVTDDGLAKVLDFGLAQRSDGDASSNPFSTAGTVSYMSPEQIRGEKLDERTDIWSLGVVLYEMIAGSRPFTGTDTSEILDAILDRAPEAMSANSNIESIVTKCLQNDRNDRYSSVKKLLDDLVEVESPPARTSQDYWPWALGGLVVVLVLAFLIGRRDQASVASPAMSKPIGSVAVLPFRHAGIAPNKEYVSDGIVESLINRMSQIQNLEVKARSSVFRYKDVAIDARQVGSELGVQAVLIGDIVEKDKNLTIDLSLVDTSTGDKIWNERYDRPSSDVVRLQNDIAVDVTAKLRGSLSAPDRQKLVKNYTNNPQAYNDYLLGKFYWNKRTGTDIENSIVQFQKAIDLDPKFALAYAGMADSYVLLPSYEGALPPEIAFPKAKEAAEKALALDDSLAEAHTALSFALFNFDWDFAESEKHFSRAIAIDPNYATAYHWYGNANLLAYGRFDDSIEAMKRARELDPLSLIINADLGTSYCYAMRLDEAIDQFNKTLELDHNFYYAHVYLARTYLLKGDNQKALDELQQASGLSEDPRILMLRSRIYSKMGRKANATQALSELQKMSKKRYVSNFDFALTYTGLGDYDNAFASLQKALATHDGNLLYLKADPLLADLRSDPRYYELLTKIGLEK
ncbi:MAG: protein kinase [Acidobacteriota bacterium]